MLKQVLDSSRLKRQLLDEDGNGNRNKNEDVTVSYTHLTLPTTVIV